MPKSPPRPLPATRPGTRLADEPEPTRPRASPAEIASYVAAASAELSFMARDSGLDVLAYLLDMARLEAQAKVEELKG